jgi:hypothetical protein
MENFPMSLALSAAYTRVVIATPARVQPQGSAPARRWRRCLEAGELSEGQMSQRVIARRAECAECRAGVAEAAA